MEEVKWDEIKANPAMIDVNKLIITINYKDSGAVFIPVNSITQWSVECSGTSRNPRWIALVTAGDKSWAFPHQFKRKKLAYGFITSLAMMYGFEIISTNELLDAWASEDAESESESEFEESSESKDTEETETVKE